MPVRRLEDRIRELCARTLHAREPEWSAIISELQLALQEHNLRVRNLAATVTVAGKPHFLRERRGS